MSSASVARLQGALVLVVVAWFANFAVFPVFFRFFAVDHFGTWFVDSWAILASNDAVARGWDPRLPNPLDIFNRPHVYSHWWLGLRELGVTRAHNLGFGLTIIIVFLASALARLRPRTSGELLWYGVFLAAPGVLLAVNRANNDLVVFAVLAPLVPCLMDGRRPVRMFAGVLVAVAAGLKFYPAVAGLVLLAAGCGSARETWERAILALLALVLVGADLAGDLAIIGGLAPKAEGLTTFGAGNLPAALGMTGDHGTMFVVAAAGCLIFAALRGRWLDGWSIAPADRAVWLSFVLGAVLLTGCFLAGTNFGYRWVFAIWLAPLLWRLPRDRAAPPSVRRLAAATAGLLVFALWADAAASFVIGRVLRGAAPEEILRAADRFHLAEQPLIWALFGCLLTFIVHHCRTGWKELLGETPR